MFIMWASSILISVLMLQAVALNNYTICSTPTSEGGACVMITDCPGLHNELLKENLTDLVKKSICKEGDPLYVCCQWSAIKSKGSGDRTTVTFDFLEFNLESNGQDINCGEAKSGDKISNGVQTNIGEFPWMAALVYQSELNGTPGVKCGGALISSRYVLTAAHCINRTDTTLSAVRLGDWDLCKDPDCYEKEDCAPKVITLGIAREIRHDLYNQSRRENDIGLIELSGDVTFTDYVRPICLPPKNVPPITNKDMMTVTGWGITETGSFSNILLKTEVGVIKNKDCEMMLQTTITDKQICAVNAESDACNGDSGGPLMRKLVHSKGRHWFLEGLVGFGEVCRPGSSGGYTSYTRVSQYVAWINHVISSTPSSTDVTPKKLALIDSCNK